MRKTILSAVAAAALSFGAYGAQAQTENHLDGLGFFEFSPGEFKWGSDLNATVEFDKRIVVLEAVRKVKLALVLVGNVYIFGRGAESIVVVHQDTSNNSVDTGLQQDANPNAIPQLNLRRERLFVLNGIMAHHQLRAVLRDSLNRNSGIAQFNQDAGNTTNQGNTLSAAVAFNASFADSMAAADQVTNNNSHTSRAGAALGTQKYATIAGSGNRNSGALMVNQNVGSGNNQLNAVSIAVGKGGAQVALSEADLGQFNTNNIVNDANSIRRNRIVASFNGNNGLVLGNQAGGNHINQGTVISIAGAVR